ncbi:DUF3090 domain-containing protein [Caldilinea sp.]|jgi:uncharacterized repeat protein (TIGR03847 family)|uniref:DUF3090 domain-containing protein n=1 Tax=Caldilinea sp. TaxID=2293560 RepID=UPI002579D5E3|nr:DUF3090 domain-containing protein [Caldilinea sp.]
MPGRSIDLNPVSRITVGAIGKPGQRTFYIQARKGAELVTLVCEKEQVSALCMALEQWLEELRVKYPKGAKFSPLDIDMELEQPLAPLFRVGQMGLGYDEKNDLTVIVLTELLPEDVNPDEASSVRLFCSRAQIEAFSRHGLQVVAKGRPICPLCGKPMDADGEIQGFCPRRNGHSDEIVFA